MIRNFGQKLNFNNKELSINCYHSSGVDKVNFVLKKKSKNEIGIALVDTNDI